MITVALVGCAHIHTPKFAEKLTKRTDIKVAVVWDHHLGLAEKYAAKLGAKAVGDAAQVWPEPGLDAAIICSETVHHEALVTAGAAAGKHLFVEKPLGSKAAEARRMAQAIREAGVIFQTGFFRRGSAANRTMKSLLERGALGQVTRVRDANMHHGLLAGWFDPDYRWMTDPSLAGVGAFGDMGAHAVDLLIWLCGEIESVTGLLGSAVQREPMCDQTGEALVRFKSGANGTVGAGWIDHGNAVSTDVSGSKGHACIQNNQLFLNCDELTGQKGFQPYSEHDADLPHAFDLFLDAVGGMPGLPLVPLEDAVHGVAVIEAIYEGAAGRRWIDL